MSETIEANDAVYEMMGKPDEIENLMEFTGPNGKTVFLITPDGRFVLGVGCTNQDAAKLFVEYVNKGLEVTKDDRIKSLEMRNQNLVKQIEEMILEVAAEIETLKLDD